MNLYLKMVKIKKVKFTHLIKTVPNARETKIGKVSVKKSQRRHKTK